MIKQESNIWYTSKCKGSMTVQYADHFIHKYLEWSKLLSRTFGALNLCRGHWCVVLHWYANVQKNGLWYGPCVPKNIVHFLLISLLSCDMGNECHKILFVLYPVVLHRVLLEFYLVLIKLSFVCFVCTAFILHVNFREAMINSASRVLSIIHCFRHRRCRQNSAFSSRIWVESRRIRRNQ